MGLLEEFDQLEADEIAEVDEAAQAREALRVSLARTAADLEQRHAAWREKKDGKGESAKALKRRIKELEDKAKKALSVERGLHAKWAEAHKANQRLRLEFTPRRLVLEVERLTLARTAGERELERLEGDAKAAVKEAKRMRRERDAEKEDKQRASGAASEAVESAKDSAKALRKTIAAHEDALRALDEAHAEASAIPAED